ncbi:MFS transporter [Polymorphobacter fuscus]|uniref:MFS transporter n=1 Tax=Sandarakinorhabdus fusca TaxID=1439888 RepID=A0A7C9KI17_9SPHN|nr:MFS transporter [Polymorphobacter fuscus]KAB7647656.1 MFS transporter [Polymorphobacter fuscus]MQT16941.1 MFS transporter [Polymorphobacter fuscus]NJC09069.1 UMF1 family MFS transporter [Polymorphobacter fuscus]
MTAIALPKDAPADLPGEAPVLPATRPGAAGAWALAQAARDPYVILITIYIFAPYYVTRVIGDPVAGQTLVAGANKWGGWIVMATAPLLGATIDRLGPRKPWLAAVVALMVAMTAALWFTPPGGGGLSPAMVATILAAMTVAFAYHEMLHNALLVPAAGLSGAARASGLGLAGGNAMSVLMLVGVLIAFALPGKVAWGWLPAAPLWGLDPALGEPDRVTTLIVAAAMAAFSLPLFLKVPDMARSALSLGGAVRTGAADLAALFRGARGHRNVLTYLLARMIFTDGLTAILVFSGLFAAGAMQWATLEMLAYGIILSVAAVVGGLLAGWLDDAVGPKTSLKLELALLIVFEALALGMGRHRMFYQPWDGPALWDGPMFTTLPELVFLGLGCIIAITVTAAYASSRTMLTRVAPPDQLGVFFGLYVLSGNATMWLGPLLIEAATRIGGSQSAGLTPILGMLGLGWLLLFVVRGGGPVK